MKVLAKNGKLLTLDGKVILPPDTPSELKPCTLTITSDNYGPEVYLGLTYVAQNGQIVCKIGASGAQRVTLPYKLLTVQNQLCVISPSGVGGVLTFDQVVNAELAYSTGYAYVRPTAAECSIRMHNSD